MYYETTKRPPKINHIPPEVLLSSSCKILARRYFFLCYSLNFYISFSLVVGRSFTGSNIFLLSNKNFSGWRTYVVSFTFLVCPDGISFADDFPDFVFYFNYVFLCDIFDVLNFEFELKFDFIWLPCVWLFMFTVRPKSGMSKFLSFSCVNYRFVNKFRTFDF